MSCFTKVSKLLAFFLFAFFLFLFFSGCKSKLATDLPKSRGMSSNQRYVKRVKFDLPVDTPFVSQNKLYLSAIGDSERDSYYNLLLEYDLKTSKQRTLATSSYHPGNIQKIKANNRWLVFCDGRAEVGPEELVVVDLKRHKKMVYYKTGEGEKNQLKLVGSLSLYQNYLAFCANSNLSLIDLEKEKVLFQRKLNLETGAVSGEVSFDQGKIFWSERVADKVVFYSYGLNSGKLEKFALLAAKRGKRYGFSQVKNGFIYFAEFPDAESSLYELKSFYPKTGEFFTIEKNCTYRFSLFDRGVLYSVRTQRGNVLRVYYYREKRKKSLDIESFSKTLAQLNSLPNACKNYFLAVEPRKNEKLEAVVYLIDLNKNP